MQKCPLFGQLLYLGVRIQIFLLPELHGIKGYAIWTPAVLYLIDFDPRTMTQDILSTLWKQI